jgi:mono/diheme cytochrome c family protein
MSSARKLAGAVMAVAFAVVATRGLEAQTAPVAPPAAAAPATAEPPAGPGLAIIKERCSVCHTTASVFNQHRAPDDWAATVQLMVDRGAELSPDETNIVIDYLANNYGVEPAKTAAK